MASVNSVIIEGIYTDEKLVTTRKYLTMEGEETKEYCFPLTLSNKMKEHCKEGKRIRIVGRLEEQNNKISIVPEHIQTNFS